MSPKPSGSWFLTSLLHGQRYSLCFSVPSSLLQPRHSGHPNVVQSFLHPSSSYDQVLRTCPCLSVHASLVFLRGIAWIGSRHTPHFSQLLTLVLGCPFLPIDLPGLLQRHLFHVLPADHSHVHRHLPFKKLGVPLWPLDAQITSLAHDGSCRSSHLSPCLHFENLLPPSLHLLCAPFSLPDFLRPSKRDHGGKFFLHFEIIHVHEE